MRVVIKTLILVTIALSVIGAFLPQTAAKLILSSRYEIWQMLTYPLIEPGPFSFRFFVNLAFNMYLLWIFGLSLIERTKTIPFLILYFGASLVGAAAVMLFPHPFLYGSTNSVYAILTAWTLLNARSELLLFFTIPFKAHWLIALLIGSTLFLDLTNSEWIRALSLAAAVLFSYFFTLIYWKQQSPFLKLNCFERKILRLFEKKGKPYRHSKVYDIKSGEALLNDDQFMDAMLEQIGRLGEKSLTAAERKRMQEISRKQKH